MTKLLLSSLLAVAVGGAVAPPAAAETSTAPRPPQARDIRPADLGPIKGRFLVVGGRSVVPGAGGDNVATVIRIVNTGSATCNYLVRFSYSTLKQPASLCDLTASVGPFNGWTFCSRQVPDWADANIVGCFAVCGNGGLNAHDLKAVIYSTDSAACSSLVVDALVVTTDSTDANTLAMRSPAVVKIDKTETNWTNKGD